MQTLTSKPREIPALKKPAPALTWTAAFLFLAIALAYVYYLIFTRKEGDDEGYLMITLQSFFAGQPLYDSVFTQYGPFYYIYQWILHTLTTLPVTHDITRMLCIFHWIMASALLGLTARFFLRSTLAGFFVFMQSILHLTLIANEPGHPQEIIVVFLALGMLVVLEGPHNRLILILLGAITAALACMKINVGAFFGFALALALLFHSDRSPRGIPAWVLIGLCSAVPFLLMRNHLTQPWCRNYSLLAGFTILAASTFAHRFAARDSIGLNKYVPLALSFLAFSAFFLGLAFLNGTTIQGLLDGLILTPLKLPSVALLPNPVSNMALLSASGSLVFAFAVWFQRVRIHAPPLHHPEPLDPYEALLSSKENAHIHRTREIPLSSSESDRVRGQYANILILAAKALFGLMGSLLLVGHTNAQFDYLLPWIWLVVVPVDKWNDRESFARVFLCLAAAWQSLQAYPIAGTQVTIATFLLPLIYTICIGDAFRALTRFRSLSELSARLNPRWFGWARSLLVMSILLLFAFAWCKPFAWHKYYAGLTPLDLPGSAKIRMSPEATKLYQDLSRYLETESDTFITYPGVNSLYFWTGKKPPTHLNSTGWGLFTPRQQEQIRDALLKSSRPLILVHENLAASWERGIPPPIHTLVDFVQSECTEIHRIPPYIIYQPKSRTEAGR